MKAKNLYEFIDMTKERAAMYIGKESLSALYFNINGYLIACDLYGIEENLEPEFGLFHNFVAEYYLFGDSVAGWRNIILAKNYGNEEQALKDFYKLFDLFRQRPKKTNSKKMLYKVLKKSVLVKEEHDEEYFQLARKKLLELPEKLCAILYVHQYEDLLEELKEFSKTNPYLHNLLADIFSEID